MTDRLSAAVFIYVTKQLKFTPHRPWSAPSSLSAWRLFQFSPARSFARSPRRCSGDSPGLLYIERCRRHSAGNYHNISSTM